MEVIYFSSALNLLETTRNFIYIPAEIKGEGKSQNFISISHLLQEHLCYGSFQQLLAPGVNICLFCVHLMF